MKISPVWPLIPIRLVVGVGFLLHGYAKLARGPEFFEATLQALGVPAPWLSAWATIFLEVFGGLAILAGVTSVLLVVPLATVMVVAIVTVHWPFGFSSVKLLNVGPDGPQFGKPGYEICLLYLAGPASLCLGSGKNFSFRDIWRRYHGPLAIGLLLLSLRPASSFAATPPRFKAIAFDYFVIFDPNSVAVEVEAVIPGKGLEFTKAWRAKQFEYGFLRSITGAYEDFFEVTGNALDYTAEAMQVRLSSAERTRLLGAYLRLKPWPDTAALLQKIKASGMRVITIANFSRKMLEANAKNAGFEKYFDELLSTEVNNTYKPDAKAYELGLKRLGLRKEEVVFAAFGGWDAYGARSFGFSTVWVNRLHLPTERLDQRPEAIAGDAQGLLEFLGLGI